MDIYGILMFTWGFGLAIYFLALGVSRLISENLEGKLDAIDKDMKELENAIKQGSK